MIGRLFSLLTLGVTSLVLPVSAYAETMMGDESDAVHLENWWDACLDTKVPLEVYKDWVGSVDAASRVAMRRHVAARGYTSILDIPCGLAFDYIGFSLDNYPIDYTGIDISQKICSQLRNLGYNIREGSIDNIPFEDNAVDVVYSRHILEHLPSYQKAVDEVIRVAAKEACIVFFMVPGKGESINLAEVEGYPLYHNCYDKFQFESHLARNPKVRCFKWEWVNDNEAICHVYVGC